MLDPRVNETRGNQLLSTAANLSQNYKDFLFMETSPPGYIQTIQKKNTVKELLMMKRRNWSCSQEDGDIEHKFKSPKTETYAIDVSPYMLDPHAPVNPHTPARFLPASPENGHVTPPHKPQHLAPRGQVAPAAGAKVTLFHWQIQQEAQKIGGVSPELLNMQDADGDTFLHIAVAQGRRALSYVLAGKMARCGTLDTKEHNGQTALQVAATTNQHLIVHDLLAHGAQINTRDFWGRSPLHVCAEKGHFLCLQSIWKTLRGSGQSIDVEMFNYDGLTPLHAAVMSHNAVLKEQRCLENTCSFMGLQLAQRRQVFVECIKNLLHIGASCGTKDLKSGRTCLHMACEEANVELLQLFLDQPCSLSIVNVKTFSGNTALHIVSALENHKPQVEAVKLLMRKGADPGTRNFENELPSQLVPEGSIGEKVRQILKGKHVHA